jgi:two-component system sensor histidine kinase KdpD
MTDSSLLDAGVEPFVAGDFTTTWAEALRSAPWFVQYAASMALVGLAVAAGFGLERVVPPANLTLVFVLPVVVAATIFGWGPSLAAVVAGVLAFDFFFTEPYFQFTIASPADFWAAILLLVVAAMVSGVSAEMRRRERSAQRTARQASALQALAHVVIAGRPHREIVQAAADALHRIFGGPATIFEESNAGVELVARAGDATVTTADEEAAIGVVALQLPSRGRAYPFEESHFDFWPIRMPSRGVFVLGVDFGKSAEGRPPAPERLVEVVGAYLADPVAKPLRAT